MLGSHTVTFSNQQEIRQVCIINLPALICALGFLVRRLMNQKWSERPYSCTSCTPERRFKTKGGLASHRTTIHALDDDFSNTSNLDISPFRLSAGNEDDVYRMSLGDIQQPQTPQRLTPYETRTPQMNKSPTGIHPSPSRNTNGRTAYLNQQTENQHGGDYRREWHPTISGTCYVTLPSLITTDTNIQAHHVQVTAPKFSKTV